MKSEAAKALDDVLIDYPEYASFCEAWKKTYRLNTVACSSFIAKQFFKLEGVQFDEELRKRVYVASATACVSDDLTDGSDQIDPKEVFLLDRKNHRNKTANIGQQFFYALHSGLVGILPQDFEFKFEQLIKRYNQYQEKGRGLNSDISPEEIIRIKNGTGGFPFLLLYAISFPEVDDLPASFESDYSLHSLPETKEGAIFNYGSMLSRLDDLDDLKYDSRKNRKSLATERLTSWREIGNDIEYVRSGLERFYPKERVDSVISIYTPVRLLHLTSIFLNISHYLETREKNYAPSLGPNL